MDKVFEDLIEACKTVESKKFVEIIDELDPKIMEVLKKDPGISSPENIAFIEWEMGLKIKGIEFIYPVVSRLEINSKGKVISHRDYFDFIGPTFFPVPILGGFVKWLYKRFVD